MSSRGSIQRKKEAGQRAGKAESIRKNHTASRKCYTFKTQTADYAVKIIKKKAGLRAVEAV